MAVSTLLSKPGVEALGEAGHDGLAGGDEQATVVADRAFVGLDPVADAADPAGHVVPGAFETVPEAVDDACACVDEDAAGVGEETANGARQASEPADYAVPRVPGTVAAELKMPTMVEPRPEKKPVMPCTQEPRKLVKLDHTARPVLVQVKK